MTPSLSMLAMLLTFSLSTVFDFCGENAYDGIANLHLKASCRRYIMFQTKWMHNYFLKRAQAGKPSLSTHREALLTLSRQSMETSDKKRRFVDSCQGD